MAPEDKGLDFSKGDTKYTFNENQLKAQRDLINDINVGIDAMNAGSTEYNKSLIKQNENFAAILTEKRKIAGTDALGGEDFQDLVEAVNDLKSGNQSINTIIKKRAKFLAEGKDDVADLYNTELKRLQTEKLAGQAMGHADKLTGGMASKLKENVKSMKGMSKGAIASSLSMGLVVGAVVLLGKALSYASGIIDKLGGSFGVVGAQSGVFRDNMMKANTDVMMLGFSLAEATNVVKDLSANFGVTLTASSELPLTILDTAKAIGLSDTEASKLFGTLMSVGNLTAEQAEHLAESTYQLATQNDVNPVAVMQDIAGSAEMIAKHGADNLESISKAAVQARQLGLSLGTVDKISESLLSFQSSIQSEIEASVMTGKQLNLQKARELALTGDMSGMMDEVLKQVGGVAEFNKLDILQRKSLAKSLGLEVSEMEKLVDNQGKSVEQQKAFKDLIGSDAMSALTSVANKLKSIGADILQKIGQPLADAMKDFEDKFITDENIEKVKDFSRNLIPFIESAIEGIKSFGRGLSNAVSLFGGINTAASFTADLLKFIMRLMTAIMTLGVSELLFGASSLIFGTGYVPDLFAADDFRSSGGSHLILTPTGKMLQTNPNDTVMGSTKVNDFISGGEGSMPLGADMSSTNQKLDRLNTNIETLVNLTRGNPGKIIDGIGALSA